MPSFLVHKDKDCSELAITGGGFGEKLHDRSVKFQHMIYLNDSNCSELAISGGGFGGKLHDRSVKFQHMIYLNASNFS